MDLRYYGPPYYVAVISGVDETRYLELPGLFPVPELRLLQRAADGRIGEFLYRRTAVVRHEVWTPLVAYYRYCKVVRWVSECHSNLFGESVEVCDAEG